MKKTAQKTVAAPQKPSLFALPEKDLKIVAGGRGIVVSGPGLKLG